MPTLLVLRHGAAASTAGDRDRPLTAQGRRDAAAAGRALAVTDPPDRALISSARRAQETFAAASELGGWRAEAHVLDLLYQAGPQDVLAATAEHASGDETVLIVGHEPWCSALIELLTGARVRMSAAALASMQVGPSWDALDPHWCALQWFAPPRVLARVAAPAFRELHTRGPDGRSDPRS